MIQSVGWVGINGPAPVDSVLIYSPYRRYEAWRYLTYMLVHSGYHSSTLTLTWWPLIQSTNASL
jgi:rhomboid-related protein 1/2/3